MSAQIELKPAQQTALAALSNGRLDELTRGAYQQLTGMSRSQAAYDLADLVAAGIVERVGGGRSTRYRLAAAAGGAGKRQWTSERIRVELTHFCRGRSVWPSAAEFRANGRTDLYVAASRYGGIGHWAAELGLPKAIDGVRRPRRLVWAVAGAALGAVLAGTAAAVVQNWPRSANPRTDAATAQTKVVHSSRPHHRVVARPAAPAKPAMARSRSTRRPTIQQKPTSRPPTSQLVVRTVAHVAVRGPAPSRAADPGPNPLAAPSASSAAPAPLPAPG